MNTLFTTSLAKATIFLAVSTNPFLPQMPDINKKNKLEIQVASVHSQVMYAENTYDEYVGKYKLDIGEDKFFVLTYKDGRLLGDLSGAGTIEIFPEEKDKDKFFAKAAPAQFTFTRDTKGKIDSLLIVITGKGEMKGKKV